MNSLIRIGNIHLFKQFYGPLHGFPFSHLLMFHNTFHDLPPDLHGRIERCHGILKNHGRILASVILPLFFRIL